MSYCGSVVGCCIVNRFYGDFGYIDDTSPLAPMQLSLRLLLEDHINYAYEFSLLFNLDKTNILILIKMQ